MFVMKTRRDEKRVKMKIKKNKNLSGQGISNHVGEQGGFHGTPPENLFPTGILQ